MKQLTTLSALVLITLLSASQAGTTFQSQVQAAAPQLAASDLSNGITGSGSVVLSTNPTLGQGTGVVTVSIDGGNSGTAGSGLYFKGAGTTAAAVGLKSNIDGGTYDASLKLYAANSQYYLNALNSFVVAGTDSTGKIIQSAFAHTQSSVAAPTGTTDTTGKMMGLAGTVTPTASGKVHFSVCGDIANSTITDGSNVQLRTGTGAAPANGDALTGTTRGSLVKHTSPVGGTRFPFCVQYVVTGLSVGTAYWIDVGLAAVTAGTASIADVDILADEMP